MYPHICENVFFFIIIVRLILSMERSALKQGQLFGSWETKERLGMGGFGHVYLYQHVVSCMLCILEGLT